LALAFAAEQHRHLSERFAWLLEKLESSAGVQNAAGEQEKPQAAHRSVVEALAEMAAGAAHELNNPLSVISGRAQLLSQSASDEQSIAALEQIQENAAQITGIIDDLMAFANPQPPRRTQVNVGQIVDEAVELAARKTGVDHINIQTEIPEELADVFVDSAQVASALANLVANAVESYEGQLGPVKISATPEQPGGLVALEIADLGCGMDAETLSRATQPFFSARAAGRKRGMGLAHVVRLIELNGGTLEITSQPGQGTTAIVHLPCR
jgi:signal transduction histidine kinase